MKLLNTLFAALSLSGVAVRAHPFDLPFEMTEEHHSFLERNIEEQLEERQISYVAIKGVPTDTVAVRQEIRTLIHQNAPKFALFIQAMTKFMHQPVTKQTSYYKVAGIHGVPRKNWNNVDQCAKCEGADGYCTHASVLFPAWHRAYMALFEQELYAVVQNIANQYPAKSFTSGTTTVPSRAEMKAIAKNFRMPYWDWASIPPSGQHNLPGSISGSVISIIAPTGLKTVHNPLFRYNFTTSPDDLVYSPFVTWDFTRRYPTNDSPTAVSNTGACVEAFDGIQTQLQDQIYQLMTTCTDYNHFSNANAVGSTSCSNSLEGIHNLVHQTAGGPNTQAVPEGGHMTFLSLAAFDPIFWLHHANVDRFFAMWQTLHDSYGATQTQVSGTWSYPTGSVQGPDSPLKPFTSNKQGTFWTTNTVKNWANKFHYTYPEFVSGGSRAQIASAVNNLYGPSATAPAPQVKRDIIPDVVDMDLVARQATSSDTAETATSVAATATSSSIVSTATPTLNPIFKALNGSLFQYVANVRAPQHALGGSYTIYLFDGQPTTTDPEKYLFDKHLIGPVAVLTMASSSNQTAENYIKSSVPLTRTLQSAVRNHTLADMTEMNVATYLKERLIWKIAGPDGTNVDPDSLHGFKIGVYASTSTLGSELDLPVWTPFFPLEEITKGKAGGLDSLVTSAGAALGTAVGGIFSSIETALSVPTALPTAAL